MASVFKDPQFCEAQLGQVDLGALHNKNMITQPYTVSNYSGLGQFPGDGDAAVLTTWKNRLSNNDAVKPLFKRTVCTWKVFPGKSVWQKEKEMELRAPMNADKTINGAASDILSPVDAPTAYTASPLYTLKSENMAYDDYNRVVEIRDAHDKRVSNFYDIKTGAEFGGSHGHPGLYLVGQVLNADRNSCAVLTGDEIPVNNAGVIQRMPAGWSVSNATFDNATPARSGSASFSLSSSQSISLLLPSAIPGKTYVLTYWVKMRAGAAGNSTVNGTFKPMTYTFGKDAWQRMENKVRIISLGASATIECTAGTMNVDDIRFAPVDAHVTTMTYDRNGWVTSFAGPDDNISYFRYDAFGRLTEVRDFQGVLVSTQAQQDAK
jgi:YD repeat-containing protein